MNNVITRAPWSWRLLRAPDDSLLRAAAPTWDERFASRPASGSMPLTAALDLLPAPPARVLDVGTGTGAAALVAAERWPDAQVHGHRRLPGDDRGWQPRRRPGRAFASRWPTSRARPGRGLRPRGAAEHAAVLRTRRGAAATRAGTWRTSPRAGPRRPSSPRPRRCARGFERHGLETVASGTAGPGTYYLARRP